MAARVTTIKIKMAVPCTVGYGTVFSMLGTFFSAYVIYQATQSRLAGQQGLVTPRKELFIVTSASCIVVCGPCLCILLPTAPSSALTRLE